MALLNFTGGGPPPAPNLYHAPPPPYVPPQQPQPYHYPRPFAPFNAEEEHRRRQNEEVPRHPQQPQQFTKVRGGGSKTQLHAVVDYDYYDELAGVDVSTPPPVTPIQGPIFLKNGTVPVVPLYSYPQLNNGSFVQIPILWTALSVALGLELRGEYIRGVPCIKKYQQLFCPTAGNTYPLERIESFIDDNKALMKRMYGEFTMSPEYGPGPPYPGKDAMPPGVPDLHSLPGSQDSFFASNVRTKRQSFTNNNVNNNGTSGTGRVDACESKTEIVTPFWASNSAGKIRAIVNTQHFEQAIHQEVCAKSRTNRCAGDCGCEQKYKWHRLLAYDPDEDCKGIFMDWFLFPSCCVCRCSPK